MKDYFSHDYYSRNDPKMVRLFMKHGLSGVGAFWCVVEMLYEEGGYMSLKEYERITFELRTDENVIRYLIYDSELFSNDGEKFWSETAILRLKKRAEKSEKARQSIENRWNKKKENTTEIRTYNECNTIKVKERKVNEIKEDNIQSQAPEIYTVLSFFEFWDLYDKKVGDKTKLEKKWNGISEKDRELIKDHIPKYIASQPEKKFRKDPQTYLNNKSWNDEIITENKNTYAKTEYSAKSGRIDPNDQTIFRGLKESNN